MSGRMKSRRTIYGIVLIVTLLVTLSGCGGSQAYSELLPYYEKTGSLLSEESDIGVGSINGEWRIVGLARAGQLDANMAETYLEAAEAYVQSVGDTRLHPVKSTENSRVILGITAAGGDAQDVAGYNLLEGLADMEYVTAQGINGPIWALIAVDSGAYDIPEATDGEPVTREKLIRYLLDRQNMDGGWAFTGETSDIDITAMAIQALAPYSVKAEVGASLDEALQFLEDQQDIDGGYASWGTTNSESCAQVLVALTAVGIDPQTDERYSKDGHTVVDALNSYWVGDGFCHTQDIKEADSMATEQAYYAMVSYVCMLEQKGRLYDFTGGDETATGDSCTVMIECSTVLSNMDQLTAGKADLIPQDGVILETQAVEYEEGDTVYDILQSVCQENEIQMEASWTPVYNSAYIEGIQNLYEFDCGELSGWMYCVNGTYPNYGCSAYEVAPGDQIEWHYTCDLGKDLGYDWIESE